MVKWHALICHGASIDARGGARERLSVRALSLRGLTPVGNRLRRLIFPLPVPVDGVSRARWEAEISSGAVHRESPRLHGRTTCVSRLLNMPQLQGLTLVFDQGARRTRPGQRRRPVNTRQRRRLAGALQ